MGWIYSTPKNKKTRRVHISTKIEVTYNDKEYTLEFSRQSVRQMEAQGFVASQVEDKPMTMIPLLVRGAFYKNHRGLPAEKIDEIYDNLVNKMGEGEEGGFIVELIKMYAETLNTLMDDKKEKSGNSASWTVKKG